MFCLTFPTMFTQCDCPFKRFLIHLFLPYVLVCSKIYRLLFISCANVCLIFWSSTDSWWTSFDGNNSMVLIYPNEHCFLCQEFLLLAVWALSFINIYDFWIFSQDSFRLCDFTSIKNDHPFFTIVQVWLKKDHYFLDFLSFS